MRVMVLIKASKECDAGVPPDEKCLTELARYNNELLKAGVMLAGEGLYPISKGVRVHFSGAKRLVTDGPFAETKEVVGGFWLWQVKSMDEAIEWVKRCPDFQGKEAELEIRQVLDMDDFGAEVPSELRAQKERQRAQEAAKAGR